MRGVIQRVSSASVSVNGKSIANIKNGVVILLGIEQEDTSHKLRQCLLRTQGKNGR